MTGWQLIKNGKRCERKQSWPILRYLNSSTLSNVRCLKLKRKETCSFKIQITLGVFHQNHYITFLKYFQVLLWTRKYFSSTTNKMFTKHVPYYICKIPFVSFQCGHPIISKSNPNSTSSYEQGEMTIERICLVLWHQCKQKQTRSWCLSVSNLRMNTNMNESEAGSEITDLHINHSIAVLPSPPT
jgi:hypothetical protein